MRAKSSKQRCPALCLMRITFERFSFFLSVFDCFDQLSIFVLFGGFVISTQVFNEISVLGQFWSRNGFFCQNFCFAVWS